MTGRSLSWAWLLLLSAAACAVAEEGGIRAAYRSDLVPLIGRNVNAKQGDWLTLYKDLHAHPELSLQEKRSAELIAQRMASAGYEVTASVGGHGVVGVMKNGNGPTVLIRGDMDALPVVEETELPYRSEVTVTRADGHTVGVMHACGHDMHQTVLVGTAETLAATRDRWRGTLVMIAQPAEEIGAGARAMIEDGLFERFPKPDYCLALHVADDLPAGDIGYTSGWALANVDSVDITIFGRGGHGSRPSQAVDPIVAAAHVIVALQTIVSRRVPAIEPGVVTVGSIHAGAKHNIIPNEAKMLLTVRSYTDETRKILLDGIRKITVNTCRAMGCPKDPDVVVREDEFTPATYNDPALTEAAVGVLKTLLGDEHVQYRKAKMGGEDFGRYPRYLGVPGFIYWLGSVQKDRYAESQKPGAPPLPSVHSSKYAPDPKPTIETGVKAMTSVALALLGEGRGEPTSTRRNGP